MPTYIRTAAINRSVCRDAQTEGRPIIFNAAYHFPSRPINHNHLGEPLKEGDERSEGPLKGSRTE